MANHVFRLRAVLKQVVRLLVEVGFFRDDRWGRNGLARRSCDDLAAESHRPQSKEKCWNREGCDQTRGPLE